MDHHGIGIVIFPTSWKLGFVRKVDTKIVWALGPIRFCYHKVK